MFIIMNQTNILNIIVIILYFLKVEFYGYRFLKSQYGASLERPSGKLWIMSPSTCVDN